MRSEVASRLHADATPTTVPELRTAVVTVLQGLKAENSQREIWLVSGRVSPREGSAKRDIERRINEEASRRERIRLQKLSDKRGLNRTYFTSADIMPRIRRIIEASASAHQERVDLWVDVLGSGYVDGVHMTESAPLSKGATEEYKTARRRGLPVEYETPQVQLDLATKVFMDYFIEGKQSAA